MPPSANVNEDALRELMALPAGRWNAADLLVARNSLGLTQSELAAAIGYDRSAIAKIEGGDAAPRLVVELAVRYLVDRRPRGQAFAAKWPEDVSRFRPIGTRLGISETGFFGSNATDVHLSDGPAVWLRLMPEFDPELRFSTIELKKSATQSGFFLNQLIDGYSDLGYVRDADGFGVFGITGDRATTTSVSFAFDTGEMWGIDTYIVDATRRHAATSNQQFGMPILEDRFKLALHSFSALQGRLGLRPPSRWIAGIEGVVNAGLYYPPRVGRFFPVVAPHGRCLVDKIWESGTMTETDTPASALKPFFRKVFNAFDVERPDYLDDLSNPQ